MTPIKIHQQISFLRKQKGLTQEELGKALGVTNQTVSKWESAQCCPDISLLPALADLFGVSIDELMGYHPADSFDDTYLKLRAEFEATPPEEVFGKAFRFSALLHEAVCTEGYRKHVPWDTDSRFSLTDRASKWDFSACSEPTGTTVFTKNGVFLSDGATFEAPTPSQLRELYLTLERLADRDVLKVLFALYALTVSDFDRYVPLTDIAQKAKLSDSAAEKALEQIPLTVQANEEGILLYRIEGCYMHIPAMLLLLRER